VGPRNILSAEGYRLPREWAVLSGRDCTGRTDYTDSPDCLPILLSTSVFLLFSSSFIHFLAVGSVR